MTKTVKALCGVLVLCLVFCGCSLTPADQTVTCGELTLTLPASYVDLSDQEYAAEFAFVYGFEEEAVLAIDQSRQSLEAYYPDLDAEQYAYLLAEVNEYDCQIGKLGELVTFTYSAEVDGVSFTYVCGVYLGAENFWCVQFYCPAEDFADKEDKFMDYLQKIQVQEH